MFCEEKAAQMAAYLLLKRGGRMAYIKLMKLLYLSDRESLITYGDSMTGDKAVSMNNGPVLSQTYDLLKCGGDSEESPWNQWISGEPNYEVSLKKGVRGFDDDAFDELSKSDIKILDRVFNTFGHYKRFDLCLKTHDMCPEWQDPQGSSIPINPKDIFRSAGKTEEEAENCLRHVNERHQLKEFSSQLS